MRFFIGIIVGLIGGFILGIALSSFVAIISMIIFNHPFGIKFLPYYCSIICAVLVPIMDQKTKAATKGA